jgi:hypothetical protein
MRTEMYCRTLGALDKVEAIRAIHQAFIQLSAFEAGVERLDNGPCLEQLSECLKAAGHLGFRGWRGRPGDGPDGP